MDIRQLLISTTLMLSLLGCDESIDTPFEISRKPTTSYNEDSARKILEVQQRDPSDFFRSHSSVEAFSWSLADGSTARLTNSFGDELTPMLSPDRHNLAFASVDIVVKELKTGNISRLTSGMMCSRPRWSPDGSLIGFLGSIKRTAADDSMISGDLYQSADFYLAEIVGSNIKSTTDTPDVAEFAFDWSKDGKTIACLARSKDDAVTLDVLSLGDMRRTNVPLTLPDASIPETIAWSSEPHIVTIGARSAGYMEFLDVDVGTGEYVKIGSINSPFPVDFDRSMETGQFAVGGIDISEEKIEGLLSIMLHPIVIPGETPVWSHDSKEITYARKELPIDLLENLREGKVTKDNDSLIVLKDDGTISIGADQFCEFTPVVKEVFNKEKGEPVLVNMSKSEALELLSTKKNSSIYSQILDLRVPYSRVKVPPFRPA